MLFATIYRNKNLEKIIYLHNIIHKMFITCGKLQLFCIINKLFLKKPLFYKDFNYRISLSTLSTNIILIHIIIFL